MKKIYLIFVLSVVALVSACSSSDDFQKIAYQPADSLAVWPLNVGNQWIYTKDTIFDTIRIDTTFASNGIQMYQSNLKNIFLPEFLQNNDFDSFLKKVDSIYTIKINNHNFTVNTEIQNYSEITLPIVSQKLNNDIAFSGSNTFAHSYNSNVDSITVNYHSTILGKHLLEGVGGRAFQDVIKVKTDYEFLFPTDTKTFSLEIWLQPGVGPIKIINLQNSKSRIIHSFQIF